MTTRVYAKGIIDFAQFTRLERGHWQYFSQFNQRTYTLKLIQKEDSKYHWNCDCPGARYISHPKGEQCKHETALARMLKARYEQKCMAEIQAEEIVEEFSNQAKEREIAALRAEVAQLRAEVAETRAAQVAPDLSALFQEIAALKAENEQIKKQLATKATKRKKHQSELESAALKEAINLAAAEFERSQQSAARAAKMLTNSLAELEAIPGALKEKLDRLSENQTIADLEALEVEQEAEAALTARAAERQAEESLLAQFMPEEITPEERRAMAPLNGDQGFSLLK